MSFYYIYICIELLYFFLELCLVNKPLFTFFAEITTKIVISYLFYLKPAMDHCCVVSTKRVKSLISYTSTIY